MGAKGKGKDAEMKGKGKGKGKGAGKGKGKAALPAPGPAGLDLPIGTKLTAQFSDGEWYKATVVQVRKKAPEVKVNYNGYDASFDAWLGFDQLRSKLLPKGSGKGTKESSGLPPVGSTCQAQYAPDSNYFPAEIIEVSTAKARAKAPIKVKMEMWLPPVALKAIKAPGPEVAAPKAKAAPKDEAGLAIGMELTALFEEDGKW